MDFENKQRVEWVRQGNQAFNLKDYHKAADFFIKAKYKDGLERLGDYYMYERHLPLLAFGYYKKAGVQKKIDDIYRRMVNAIGEWLGRDKIKSDFLKEDTFYSTYNKKIVRVNSEGMLPISVDAKLRDQALSIISKKSS